ncbi:hypothetical protein EYF80_055200 [Liparis tanakae]|uniref:Uncharacterized protein n=1 Tax=Liparis tanakae TaxID=230148 RepID=A0A4Z2F0B3_9TELE|nr:hypothetical protein EYF80_055200 [Liparis tanakae]
MYSNPFCSASHNIILYGEAPHGFMVAVGDVINITHVPKNTKTWARQMAERRRVVVVPLLIQELFFPLTPCSVFWFVGASPAPTVPVVTHRAVFHEPLGPTGSRGGAYLAEEIKLLVQWGADLHQSRRAGLRLVGADGSDPDVAQIGDVQGSVGRHGQRGGRLEAGVTGVASVS